VHAVLKDFVQWDSLRNKRSAQGKLMRFRCSEDHLCPYHNHSYTGIVLLHCKQGRLYEVHSIANFQDSLTTVCLETHNKFSARAFRL